MSAPLPSPAIKPLRLFIALWPDADTRDALVDYQRAWAWPPRAALVKPEQLHLTLHFLGDVPAHRLPELASELRVGFEPIALKLVHGEVWPQGVAVLRPQRSPPGLGQLHTALSGVLSALGLPLDAKLFRAHVTLARRAHGGVPPTNSPGVGWSVREGYVLVRSLPDGAGYQILQRFA